MRARRIPSGLAALTTVLAVMAVGAQTASAATLTPTNHDFGNVNIGASSAPQTFTFTNGCATMGPGGSCITPEVSRLTPSVTPSSDYSLVNGCPQELTVNGQTCTFSVTFRPTATGLRSGIVNTGAVPMASLRGTGVSQSSSPSKKKCKKKKRGPSKKKCKKKK